MIQKLRRTLAKLLKQNHSPTLAEQSAAVIMHTCSLQLERGEHRALAATRGAVGPMLLSGGAITTVVYKVFDAHSDKVDATIKQEPWRAFATVTMRITIDKDPEFESVIDGKSVEPKQIHKDPGLLLIQHLSQYFPLISKAYTGKVYAPGDDHEMV